MSVPPVPGLVVVDKPAGLTSHDVVARIRRLAGTRKVGHAGTLDPMATGVLVLGIERATRLLTYLVGVDKTYLATIRLGISTVTDDAQGEAIAQLDAALDDQIHPDDVTREVARLTGAISQVPSSVSAVKVNGKRAYARVRAGEDVELAARGVSVHRFDVLACRAETANGRPVIDLDVVIDCSSGTYVRALARDLGRQLEVGGHLTALRRSRVGPYLLSHARTLDQLDDAFTVIPMAQAARAAFTARELSDDETRKLVQGQRLPSVGDGETPVAAFAPDGRLVAIVSDVGESTRPLLVLQDG